MILNSSTNLKTLKMIYESFKCICSAPPAGGRWKEVTLCSILVYFQLVSMSDRRKIQNNH